MSDPAVTRSPSDLTPIDREARRKSNFRALLFVGLIFLPFGLISAVITWFAFNSWRYRRSVIAMFLGIWVVLFGWLAVFGVGWLINGTLGILNNVFRGGGEYQWHILGVIGGQFFIGVPIGIAIGLMYASIKWRQRPSWEEFEFKQTPWEKVRIRKTTNEIQNDLNTPFAGVTLGVDEQGNRVIQTDAAASAHTLVVGASGSGKTTTLMSKARDSIKRGQGMVFVDLKGGTDVPRSLAKYAKRYNRKFTHWLMQPREGAYTGPDPLGPAYYDPLARGEATRRKDLIIGSRDWSEEFYKIEASNYLQLLFYVMIANPKPEVSTLSDVVSLLNPKALMLRAKPLLNDPKYADIVAGVESLNDERISPQKRNAIEGLRSQLAVILNSVAGQWLLVDPNGHNINLKDTAHNGDVVIFSLDSSNYPELAKLVASLIIQDLKTVSSELREDPAYQPMQIFIDEFSAIGSDNIIGLINKSRDAGLPVTLSTQTLGDLRVVTEAFRDQLMGIINSFIIHRANIETDAMVYAGLTGKERKVKFSQNVEHSTSLFGGIGKGGGVGSGRIEEVEDFRISPDAIQALEMGEMFYVTKSPNEIHKVQVIQEMMISEPEPIANVNFNTSNIPKVGMFDDTYALPHVEPKTELNDEPLQLESPEEQPKPFITEERLSDPDRISSILNNPNAEVINKGLPARPQLPKAPTSSSAEEVEIPKLGPKAKPSLPTLPTVPKPVENSDGNKSEFDF